MQNNSTSENSLQSQTRWPPNAFPIGPTLLTALGAVAIIFAGVIVYVFGYSLLRHHAPTRSDLPLTQQIAAQLVGYAFVYAYMLRAVPRVAGTTLAELGVRAPTLRTAVSGILGAAAMLLCVALTSALVVKVTHHEDAEAAMQLLRLIHSKADLILFIFVTVVAAPLVEEFAFRVFLYNALQRYSSVAVAAVVSSIVFGVVHGAGPSVYVPLAAGGFVLAGVYILTHNYFANVITHATFNLIVLGSTLAHPAK